MLDYAKKQNPDAILILSAKYGVLDLEQVVEPYEKTFSYVKGTPKISKAEKIQWANNVLKQLQTKTDTDNTHFVFLAGANYRENLVKHLKYFSVPIEELQIGRQLQWLGNNV